MIKKIWHSKYFPRIFYKKSDGGKDSGVNGYFLIEFKPLFSIGLLRFNEGSRDNYHSHAFSAATWWLKGHVTEERRKISCKDKGTIILKTDFKPSFKPKITLRNNVHRVFAHKTSWALTFRGPWVDWFEINPHTNQRINMTHGREVTSTEQL